MGVPPSKYSPEYFKPYKPENQACCGCRCNATPPKKPPTFPCTRTYYTANAYGKSSCSRSRSS